MMNAETKKIVAIKSETFRTQYITDVIECVEALLGDDESAAETSRMFGNYYSSLDRLNAFLDHRSVRMLEAGYTQEELEINVQKQFRKLCGYIFRKNAEASEQFLSYVRQEDRMYMILELDNIINTEIMIRNAIRIYKEA